LHCW